MAVVTRGVILAAGEGSRLVTHALPKPLVRISGVPLVFRTIDALMRAGIKEVGVVLGFEHEQVRAGIEGHPAAQHIHFIHNPRWREPNGISLRVAQSFTRQDEFILAMADHVFDARIVERLRGLPSRSGVTLAVDHDLDRVFDMDDATKVTVQQGRIRTIGKQLERYDAVDCGLFRCGPQIFAALDQAFEAGDCSVSGGMQILARSDDFHAMAIDGLYWQDVDTPGMFAEAESHLEGLSLTGHLPRVS